MGLWPLWKAPHSSSVWRMVEKHKLQTQGGLGSNSTSATYKLFASKQAPYYSDPNLFFHILRAVEPTSKLWKGEDSVKESRV